MVARPGPISLPLLAGQNQKVDPRLQSPNEFSVVENVEQTRDGRQEPRKGFDYYVVGQVAGAVGVVTKPIRCVGDGDLFVADTGDLPYWTYAYRAHVRSRAGGGLSDTGYRTAKLPSVAGGGLPNLIPERVMPVASYRGDREQTSSTVDHSTVGEWLVTANIDAGAIVVVWRSRDTLEVIASKRIEPSGWGTPTDPTNYVQCSVVSSSTTRSTVVASWRYDGKIYFHHFSDAGAAVTSTDSGLTQAHNTNDNSCIDTVGIPGEDTFALLWVSAATGANIGKYQFAPTHTNVWSLAVGLAWAQYTMGSLNVSSSEVLYGVSAGDPTAVTRSLVMGRINFTSVAHTQSATLTFSAGNIPGIPFVTHKDMLGNATAHMVAITLMNAGLPGTSVYSWTGTGAAAITGVKSFSRGVAAGRIFLNETDNATLYYSDSAFSRMLLPMMASGYSALDSDLAYDPGRPVFLMRIGASLTSFIESGYTFSYSIAGVSEAGLLALSGEVGQATHPYISPILNTYTGPTIGAPARIVRIVSNSGDDDTDLTGAYVTTFDVSVPGKSRRFNGGQWRQALRGLPRQGKLALFKPMKGWQCELEPIRQNETIVPGLTTHIIDGVSTHSCGFLEAPVIDSITAGASTEHPPGAGTYTITAVFEWTDAEGRRYQSAPAVPRDITLLAAQQATIEFAPPVACYKGVSVTVYRTPNGGSEFKRDGSLNLTSFGTISTIIQLDDSQLLAQETLYTSLGELPNDPPPSAKRFARTRDRVWAYGLDRPEVVQASKLLQDARGIVWSNAPNYFIVFPEPVVAVETLDETAVVFTSSAVYTIAGSGPDDTGIGTFTEPGRIPGYVGCVSPRSVISADAGIFFQSQRGIELLPRGFGSSQWVGQPVMNDLESYPIVRGVVADPEGDRIVWALTESDTWTERAVTYDCRTQSWSAWAIPSLDDGIRTARLPVLGMSLGAENPVRGQGQESKRIVLWGDMQERVRYQTRDQCRDIGQVDGGLPAYVDVAASWETGWCRFAGTQAFQIIRRLGILVTPVDDGWTLTVTMRFNDDETQDYTVTFDWADVPYGTPGQQSVPLEVALPVVQFESIKVELSVSGNADGPLLQVHSLSLYPETEGPRSRSGYRR